MEASTFEHLEAAPARGSTPLLRLASDERLVAITRRGNQAAFETLVSRYHARLLAFCRHMVGSREDAEDVLQEVFAAAYNAMLADDRAINVRPWLYRIARNRSLNHLRRQKPIGVDSMDVHMAEHGVTTADKVHRREDFRQLMKDVQTLPETQRTALLLREIDALRYDQIAEAMETTIPSVKSLLVRARVSLAEAAEARALSCDEVRFELGEVAEGLAQRLTAPARRHVRDCERCGGFRKQLRSTNKALAAIFPVGPLLFLKKGLLAHLGTTASAGGTAATAAVAAGAGAGSGSLLSAGIGTVASKTAAGLAAAALVTAGAVEVNHADRHPVPRAAAVYAPAFVPSAEPAVVNVTAQDTRTPTGWGGAEAPTRVAAQSPAVGTADDAAQDDPSVAGAVPIQQGYDATTLPPQAAASGGAGPGVVPDYSAVAALSGGVASPEEPTAPPPSAPATPAVPSPAPTEPAPSEPAAPPADPVITEQPTTGGEPEATEPAADAPASETTVPAP